MSSIMSSQGVVLATAMAVSGTVILLAFRLQKSPSTSLIQLLSSEEEEKREKSEKKKKKKRVHFAEDVVDPIGNSDEYRKLHKRCHAPAIDNYKYSKKSVNIQEMPANRVSLYNGILRDRVLHRVAYSC